MRRKKNALKIHSKNLLIRIEFFIFFTIDKLNELLQRMTLSLILIYLKVIYLKVRKL